jgi:hypothetical protein
VDGRQEGAPGWQLVALTAVYRSSPSISGRDVPLRSAGFSMASRAVMSPTRRIFRMVSYRSVCRASRVAVITAVTIRPPWSHHSGVAVD